MQITKPAYYDDFSCLAGTCPDTCCGAWQVVIDAQSLAFYQRVEGPLGRKLRAALTASEGEWCFKMECGRCTLLTSDGLCAIQRELGEEALCKNCGFYPRFVTEIGARRELGLSLSCPEAARMILTNEAPFSIGTVQTDEPIRAIHELSPELILTLRSLRSHALDLARDRAMPFGERCARILALCAPVDRARRDEELVMALQDGLVRMQGDVPEADGARLCRALRSAAGTLEYLQPERKERLQAALAGWAPGGWTSYCPDLRELWEQLLCYGIYKYFPRAAFDRSVWPTAVFCVLLPVLLRQLLFAAPDREAGTALRLAWQLSRELEHSEFNMQRLRRRFRTGAFRPEVLPGILFAARD